MSSPRRFIAGAVCPRCSLQDKIVSYRDAAGDQVRECVSCGFRDVMTEAGPVEEVKTRVNQPRPGEPTLSHEDEVQIVNVIDPNPGAKRRDH